MVHKSLGSVKICLITKEETGKDKDNDENGDGRRNLFRVHKIHDEMYTRYMQYVIRDGFKILCLFHKHKFYYDIIYYDTPIYS